MNFLKKVTKGILVQLIVSVIKSVKLVKGVVTLSYKIKFIDITRFIVSALSNLVHNLAEGIHKIK